MKMNQIIRRLPGAKTASGQKSQPLSIMCILHGTIAGLRSKIFRRFAVVTVICSLLSVLWISCDQPTEQSGDNGAGSVAKPSASPQGGEFISAPTVTLATATVGAAIYYTLDGSDPAAGDGRVAYTAPVFVPVDTPRTLKAIAVLGDKQSEVFEALYSKQSEVATPEANPPGGKYIAAQNVVLTTVTTGAAIYYTLDGSDPRSSEARIKYTNGSSITVNLPGTLKASAEKVIRDGTEKSAVLTASYSGDSFSFTVNTTKHITGTNGAETDSDDPTDKTFILPTAQSHSTSTSSTAGYAYHWLIDWGEGEAAQEVQGTGNPAIGSGITHTYNTAGLHQITITPAGAPSPYQGWLEAFGFSDGSGANSNWGLNVWTKNMLKMVSLDSPLSSGAKKGYNLAPPENNKVGDYYCYGMFAECAHLTMGEGFTLPQNITSVGNYFCYKMFVSNYHLEMSEGFNLPQLITSIGNYFCASMFNGCSFHDLNIGIKAMPDGFNLPQGITDAKNNFCENMFNHCEYLLMAAGFNIPPNITKVGNNFCYGMFESCSNWSSNFYFTMAAGFNLPQGITEVGDGFCTGMFNGCRRLAMSAGFNLPPNITKVGDGFCATMFSGCYGSLDLVAAGFQLPQNITTVGKKFCFYMFYGSTTMTARININAVLGDITVYYTGAVSTSNDLSYYGMFNGCPSATGHFMGTPLQVAYTPSASIHCFTGCTGLSDFTSIPAIWAYHP